MSEADYLPVYEFTRGNVVESVHFGAFTIVDSSGKLLGHYGNPHTTTYLRSTAKPFQALAFVEQGGPAHFNFTEEETALICASHDGTDRHVAAAGSIQKKAGFEEGDLQCGVHDPFDAKTAQALRVRGEAPTANRHNCSGKHSGMLAYARLNGWSFEDYLSNDNPVQQNILRVFSEMTGVPEIEIAVGIDGCSAPNFAVPLYNTALAYARLCDPAGLPDSRQAACRKITEAMTGAPFMVAGLHGFDTDLMKAGKGHIVSKGGAEGYQGIGIMPGAISPDSPGIGIAIKISDGTNRARSAVALAVLKELGDFSRAILAKMTDFGPGLVVKNWRKLTVGEGRPNFKIVQTPTAKARV